MPRRRFLHLLVGLWTRRHSVIGSCRPCGKKKKPRTNPRLDKAGKTAYNEHRKGAATSG